MKLSATLTDLACLSLLLCCSLAALAQKANFQFYNTADGLSGNYTSDLVQDDQGFIWLLNDYKLHRFDGRNFVRYPLAMDRALDNGERLIGLRSYEDSLLLILSETRVFLMNPRTDKWKTFSLPVQNQAEGFEIVKSYDKHAINASINKKEAWFEAVESYAPYPVFLSVAKGSTAFDVWKFRGGKFIHTSLRTIPYQVYNGFDRLGNLYTAQGSSMVRWDSTGRQAATMYLPPDCADCSIVNCSFKPNNDGLVLVRSARKQTYKLYVLKSGEQSLTPHPADRWLTAHGQVELHSLQTAENNDLWILGVNRKLLYYNARKDILYDFQPELQRLIPNITDIIHLVPDRTGTIWVLTRLGLLRVTFPFTAFDQYFAQPKAACNGYCSFRGFAEDAQGTVYASFYWGLARLDPNNKKELSFVPVSEELPFPWGLSSSGEKIWLNNGQMLNPKTSAIETIQGPGNPIRESGLFSRDRAGRLWWLYDNKLYRLDSLNGLGRWNHAASLPNQLIYVTEALYAGPYSGYLWISQKGRLLRYSPEDQRQTWFDSRHWRLPISRILAIEEDVHRNLWLGTDIGLVYFNPASGQTLNYAEKDGLSNNFVCGMLPEGDSCLWLSTNSGLSRFHIADKSFINFYEEDGLTHDEFNRISYFKARNGRMFFGGLRGINAFFPRELMDDYQRRNEAAQVVLSSLEYVDENRDTTLRYYGFAKEAEVQLNYWHRSFTFEYVLTDYRKPEEIYYSYQMEGYEDTWSTPSKFNFTRFSSLPPGRYTFRVKARDSHGLWHPNQLAVRVIVHPPWWETSWAYLAYCLLAFTLGYAIFHFMKRRLLLHNELSLQAREAQRLKEMDAFKSRLYTNLTHEFRTPLTVILGMIRQIRAEPKQYLDDGARLIENSGKNLLRLINQLLDLSKLEDQSFELRLQQRDIVPFLRYVTESFHTYANSKNLSLRFFTKLESLVMDYDEDQIQQVLTNLISNALKFTPSDGDILVRLSGDDQALQISVSDTGIGIAKEDLNHIFDRFYQADASDTRQGGGTGIGLAHALELVKIMGGNITVESKLGKGSTFTVTLPVRREADTGAPPTTLDREAPSTGWDPVDETPFGLLPPSPLPQLLIIEDNHDVVFYLRSCLEGRYQIHVAYNGKIGIAKALELLPDLIISDVMMPEKDGYEVCHILKTDERSSHIPIILLTAKADGSSKITGFRQGADAYLTKPFDKEELLVILDMLLERQKRMAAHFMHLLYNELPPNGVTEETIEVENAFLRKVRDIVAQHYSDEDFALPQLCQKLGMSRSQLFRKMQALINTSPSVYIRDYRLNKARELLAGTELNISEVAWRVGFRNLAHFSKAFQDKYGYAPSTTNK